MKTIAITLPDHLARKARIRAAEENISVSRFVARLLSESMLRESGYAQAMDSFLARKPFHLRDESGLYSDRGDLHDRFVHGEDNSLK